MTLALKREVDHHDGVLLDDADQHDEPDDRHHRQVEPKQLQRQQRADGGGRQAEQDREGVDEALVEDAEHDIHGEQRGGDQDRLRGQRILELLRRSLERSLQRRRLVHRTFDVLDRLHGLAERDAGREVERHRHGGELTLVVDRDRAGHRLQRGKLADRHHRGPQPVHVELAQRRDILLEAPFDLDDDMVGVERRVDLRDEGLAVGVREGLLDGGHVHAGARRRVAVDVDHQGRAAGLLVAGDILQLRHALQLGEQFGRQRI